MDGPNVNGKFVDMFSKQLLDENSTTFLNIGSCGLHIVHGAFKHGSDTTGWELEKFFSSIFQLFKDTPARRDDYTKATGSSLFALKFCEHRWVENVPVAEKTLEVLPHLRKYVKAVNDKKLPDPKTQSFDTVQKMLQDDLLEVKINIFISIAKEVVPFLTLYQTDRIMIPFLGDDLHHMLKSLMSSVISNSVLKKQGTTLHGLMKIDVNNGENQRAAHKVDVGFVASEQLKKLSASKKVSDRQVLALKTECKEAILTIIKRLWLKSPLQYRLVRALNCLSPQMMVNNSERCVNKFQIVLKVLVDAKKLKESDVDQTKHQFSCFLDEDLPQHTAKLDAFDHNKEDQHIEQLFYEMMATKQCYKKLWTVVKNLLTLSHGQAIIERGFSSNKQVSVDNLQERSFVALRQIDDYIKAVNGSLNVKITKDMICSAATARQKYMLYLEEEKKKKEKKAFSMKRKSLMEELDNLKAKKKKLECEAEGLAKSADIFTESGESKEHQRSATNGGKVK